MPVANDTMMDDAQLLRRYVEKRSQEAFAELVQRHVNLVYFAALRRVGGDAHLADDVAQRVFADLARKAPTLRGRTALTGWLYTSTRFAAAQAVRSERRRRTHEQEAQTMQEIHATADPDWNQLRPVIDEAMDELSDTDREAVLLRYFENQPLAAVGARFALSADAARMRVDRALEKLRGLLEHRGVASTSAALATVFSAQSGIGAPAGIIARIVAQATGQAGVVSAATFTLWKIVAGVAAGAAAVGVTIYEVKAHGSDRRVVPAVAVARESVDPGAATRSPEPAAPASAEMIVAAPAQPPRPAGVARAVAGFDGLSERQKNILKTLWAHREIAPEAPPSGWSFKLGPKAPDAAIAEFAAAVELLHAAGLVGVHAGSDTVFLTDAGDAFCRAHAAEIDALPSNLAAFVPMKFGALPERAKKILKTLWAHQKVSPDRPAQRWAFRVPPDSPDSADFEAAVAGLHEVNGLVGVSPQTGMVFLSDRGREFCEAHAAEIDAYPLPPSVSRPLVP